MVNQCAMNLETAVEEVIVTTQMPDFPKRTPHSFPDFPESLPSQENFNALDMAGKKRAWKAMIYVLWSIGRKAAVISDSTSFRNWLRQKIEHIDDF